MQLAYSLPRFPSLQTSTFLLRGMAGIFLPPYPVFLRDNTPSYLLRGMECNFRLLCPALFLTKYHTTLPLSITGCSVTNLLKGNRFTALMACNAVAPKYKMNTIYFCLQFVSRTRLLRNQCILRKEKPCCLHSGSPIPYL